MNEPHTSRPLDPATGGYADLSDRAREIQNVFLGEVVRSGGDIVAGIDWRQRWIEAYGQVIATTGASENWEDVCDGIMSAIMVLSEREGRRREAWELGCVDLLDIRSYLMACCDGERLN